MTESDILQIRGIGESAAEALVNDGVTTPNELKETLQELNPPAGHIYSTFQLDVISELNLPTIGDRVVTQYTRQTFTGDMIVYEWERDSETFILELKKEEDVFRVKWVSTSEEEPLRSELYNQRDDAVNALTRWAYRPPESA